MQITESIAMALGSIRANKLRAGLTLLSIGIGVFAIVGVAAAVASLNAKVDDQLSSLGRDAFVISRTPAVEFGNTWRKYRNRPDITLRQALDFKERMSAVAERVGLTYQMFGAVASYRGEETDPDLNIIGGDEAFLLNNDYTLEDGRSIDAQDVQLGSDVVVIGAQIAEDLFAHSSPLGKTIRIKTRPYHIIGVLESKGAVFGQSQDNLLLMPITSVAKYFVDPWFTSVGIVVQARSEAELQPTVDHAIGALRVIRRLELGEENDFEIATNESISETFGGFTEYISLFGLTCGAIALLAAGIGIMNIMLVSVKERTREIGVRKAVGATSQNILSQFIIEAVTLSQLGATIGVIAGLLGGLAMSAWIEVSPPIPWLWVSISFATCLFVGLVFGSYPAWKASRLDPIDALRYE
jgi:putative ABC transport system permease protein